MKWRVRLDPRPDLDREAVRYFVYMALDAEGRALYIGRSCNVRQRLLAHHANLSHCGVTEELKPKWLLDTRSLSLVGPFTWRKACDEERRLIEEHQPRGNRMFTKAHGYRPLSEGGGRYFEVARPRAG